MLKSLTFHPDVKRVQLINKFIRTSSPFNIGFNYTQISNSFLKIVKYFFSFSLSLSSTSLFLKWREGSCPNFLRIVLYCSLRSALYTFGSRYFFPILSAASSIPEKHPLCLSLHQYHSKTWHPLFHA